MTAYQNPKLAKIAFLSLLIVVLGGHGPTTRADLAEGIIALEIGDYARAVAEIQSAIDNDIADAYYHLWGY